MNNRKVKVLLEGFDVMDTVRFISRTMKKHQALLLESIENVIPSQDPLYSVIRKHILDHTNNMSRDIIKNIFGDIDG